MAKTPHSIDGYRDERGSALIGVLLLLMMMSALVAALGVGGQTETLIARNQHSGAQAQAAAEAGLNHAVEVASEFIFEWNANGFPDANAAVDSLLRGPDNATGTVATDADNLSLGVRAGIPAAAAIPLGVRLEMKGGALAVAGDAVISAEYEASVMDDDATAPGAGLWIENGNPFDDLNRRLIVRATGYGPDNTSVVLEAIISPVQMGAVVTNGDLDITGNVDISGSGGSVHANGDLLIDGSANVTGPATASGVLDGTAGAGSGGGRPRLDPFPEIRASDYLSHADFILNSDGTMTNQAGTVLCTWSKKTPCNNWDYNNGSNAWSITTASPSTGTYYVEGQVNISGSPGTVAAPLNITIIAEGSINISGSPDLIADTPELLFVTDGDLEISGGLDVDNPLTVGGQMLVHEQVKLSGNPELLGQLIVENAPSVDPLVTTNEMSGNVTITYNGNLGNSLYGLGGWRDIRQ